MANTDFTDVSNIDFTAYKESLKEFLKKQDRFRDYNFDGSDISVLLDLLSINTYNNGFMLNMTGSEMFQDTAQLRESAVSHAKDQNYIPRSRTSSTALVDVRVVPPDNPSIVVIPKFYSFVSNNPNSNRSYIFSTNEAITIRNNGGEYVANNVQIYEGRVVKEFFVANNDSRYVLSSANVDISSIDVNVRASRTDTSNTTFTRAEDLHGLNANSDIYFLQGANADQYELVFGNGIAGRKIVPGNVIQVTYRDSSASDADGITRFSPASVISGYSNITVSLSPNGTSSGGAERESIESIKFNGPRHYATQGRSITGDDYTVMIRQAFPTVQSLTVFGGEELPQKRYGKVAISAKPFGGQFLTQSLKNSITDYISERNSIVIDPIFLDPEFFYVAIDADVYYDQNATNKTTSDLETTILTAINNYSKTSLEDFKKTFKASKLGTVIDGADASISSNQTTLRIVKRKAPLLGQAQTIVIDYSTPLSSLKKGTNVVESSFFTYTVDDRDFICYFADDGLGGLHIYTQDVSGTPYILVNEVGSVNYTTGSIITKPVIFTDYQGYIAFYARTTKRDFNVVRNQIVEIDPDDVNINLKKA